MAGLKGQRFGRLVVESDLNGLLPWKAFTRCDCGNKAVVWKYNLKSGATRSCGCLNRELVRERSWRHGHKRPSATSKEYRAWTSMISRCHNPHNASYGWYGGGGATGFCFVVG